MRVNDRKYSIIIPKWDNSGRKIRVEILERIVKKMANHFGGATLIPSVLGCWVDEKRNKLVCEENAELFAIRDSETSPLPWNEQKRVDEEFVRNLAKEVADELGQSAVMITEGIQEVKFVQGRYREELPEKKVGIDWFKKLI